jgi:ParB/RepB/Spo0J family partition protein
MKNSKNYSVSRLTNPFSFVRVSKHSPAGTPNNIQMKGGKKEMVETIDISKIKVIKNTRTDLGKTDLSELMTDIRENGLIHPIGIYKTIKDEYIIAYGHRRLAALKKLGRRSLVVGDEVKILPKELTSEEFLILNLSENLHRVDNSPLELAKGCSELKQLGLNLSEIAARLSLPKSRIETALRLLVKVPESYKKEVGYLGTKARNGKIPATVANKIASLRVKQDDIDSLFEKAKKEELTVKEIDLFGKILSAGGSFKQAEDAKEKYVTIQVDLVCNKVELQKIGTRKVNNLVREIVKGKKKPIPKLLF